jgi:hypothetical protein
LEATQGDNLETLKMKMKLSANVRAVSGGNDYAKLDGKLA